MNSYSGLLRSKIARATAVAGLSAFVLVAGAAPAFADNGKHLGWYKNGKAAEKSARKAQRAARLNNGGVVVGETIRDNRGVVIDRSKTRAQRNTRVFRDRNGNRVYDYRNSRVDPYANYPQYRQNNPYYGNGGYYGNNYPYNGNGNYPYYDNREGDLDRDEVAERAARNGYYAGFQRGQFDASRRDNANPYGHGAYQYGFDGFDPEWGSASTYQQYYRQYFIQGYQDAYGQRGYNRRYNRRF